MTSAAAVLDDFRRLHVALSTDAPVPPIMDRVGEQFVIGVCPIGTKHHHLQFLPAHASRAGTAPQATAVVSLDGLGGDSSNDNVHPQASFASNLMPKGSAMTKVSSLKRASFNFAERLARALSRRVQSSAGLSEQQFAHAMTVSISTVQGWKAQRAMPRADQFIDILAFFQHDQTFRRELFEGSDVHVFTAPPGDTQLIDDLRAFEDARSRLKRRFG